MTEPEYHGRLAPSPSGYLHLGHAQTFWTAYARASSSGGRLSLRVEDIDTSRCRQEYLEAMIEDMEWFGLRWTNLTLVMQSHRKVLYIEAWRDLLRGSRVYPSPHSRKDVSEAITAPHEGDAEIIFPVSLRPLEMPCSADGDEPGKVNWRFKVPDDRLVTFVDENFGPQSFTAGVDFGDFVIWGGASNMPSYELAVVVDDADMGISEVVRGGDLVLSTARQILLYEALDLKMPSFYHCPLVRDENGKRMAKRNSSTTLRGLREAGWTPEKIRLSLFQDEQK